MIEDGGWRMEDCAPPAKLHDYFHTALISRHFFHPAPANTNRSAPVWHGSGATKSMSLKRRCARLLYNKFLGICPFIAYISDDHKGRSHVGQRNDGRLF